MSSTTPRRAHWSSDSSAQQFVPPTRPRFNSHITSDRLREGSGRLPSFPMTSSGVRKERRSVFRETGLLDDDEQPSEAASRGPPPQPASPAVDKSAGAKDQIRVQEQLRSRSWRRLSGRLDIDLATKRGVAIQDEIVSPDEDTGVGGEDEDEDDDSTAASTEPTSPITGKQPWYARLTTGRRPRIKGSAGPPATMSSLSRFTMIALLIAVVVPGFSYNNGRTKVGLSGATAGVVRRSTNPQHLEIRANSPTNVCKRWSQQTALLNGTLYIYGGQAKTTSDQKDGFWNNNLVTLDLTKSWDSSSPALSGLPQPSGPPAVANGYLWNDYNSLYLYGGEFSEHPLQSPAALATWKYTIASQAWTSFDNPQTSDGNNSAPGGATVQRSAEGAGCSVPELGLSWYFGGHLDYLTTPGWSNQVARVYLRSLLEFTHPSYTNNGVQPLASGTGAGEGGAYRNITQGGLQTDQGFSERADGVLVFVPGWGTSGVLIGLGGGVANPAGTSGSFSNDFSTLDVYDIANSVWYHQQTKGDAPSVRVNPCAVIASAPDASSFQIYLYGGQNLVPTGNQTQYSDMYILSIPSFTWVKVPDQSNPPPARAGHTCNLRDGQMVVVGGYIDPSIPCDSPGVYVFNASSLRWQSGFTALSPKPDLHPDNSILAASYGYKVPEVVVSVIGGSPDGQATATTPAAGPATGGPFATGKPPVYTITASGSAATITQWAPGSGGGTGGGSGSHGNGSNGASPGLVAAGVIAGLAGLLAGYLGYCAWLYRRQVRAYRTHLAVANRYSSGPAASKTSFAGLAALFGRKGSKEGRGGGRGSKATAEAVAVGGGSGGGGGGGAAGLGMLAAGEKLGHRRYESTSTQDSFAWVGREEPKPAWMVDEPTPGSGTSSSGLRKYSSNSPFDDRPFGWYGQHGQSSGSGTSAAQPLRHHQRRGSDSGGSTSSTEHLLDGQEPSFFSVVMGPRRALRVVNGLEDTELLRDGE